MHHNITHLSLSPGECQKASRSRRSRESRQGETPRKGQRSDVWGNILRDIPYPLTPISL
jgi:hypothetical protein